MHWADPELSKGPQAVAHCCSGAAPASAAAPQHRNQRATRFHGDASSAIVVTVVFELDDPFGARWVTSSDFA